jgi:tetratricopeptide (TPR) repeat protein
MRYIAAVTTDEERDAQQWSAVEEATELLLEHDHQKALEELRDVLRRDPHNAYAFHYLGNAFYELGQLEPARDAYRAAVREREAYLAARVALSHVLRKLGKLDEALKQAAEALRRFPDDGDAHHAAGMAYAAAGDRGRARLHLERFLATRPELEASLEVRSVLALLDEGAEDVELD